MPSFFLINYFFGVWESESIGVAVWPALYRFVETDGFERLTFFLLFNHFLVIAK